MNLCFILTAATREKAAATAPIVPWIQLSKAKREQNHIDSLNIIFEFQKLFTETTKSLQRRKISTHDIHDCLVCLTPLLPILEFPCDSGNKVFGDLLAQLGNIEIDRAMRMIGHNFCSFFNYKILNIIIGELGTEGDKHNLTEYDNKFKKYAQRCFAECPSSVGEMSQQQATIFVSLDGTYNYCTGTALCQLREKLHEILKIPPGYELKLCKIELGSLKLIFQLPYSVLQHVFPLSEDQEAALRKPSMGVDSLYLVYQFNRCQQVSSSIHIEFMIIMYK